MSAAEEPGRSQEPPTQGGADQNGQIIEEKLFYDLATP